MLEYLWVRNIQSILIQIFSSYTEKLKIEFYYNSNANFNERRIGFNLHKIFLFWHNIFFTFYVLKFLHIDIYCYLSTQRPPISRLIHETKNLHILNIFPFYLIAVTIFWVMFSFSSLSDFNNENARFDNWLQIWFNN